MSTAGPNPGQGGGAVASGGSVDEAARGDPAVLTVAGLSVDTGSLGLVHGVDLVVRRGERVGLIGESGSGKSLTALALLGLLPEELHASGSVRLAGVDHDLVGADERRLSRVRGRDVAMVFQEPMTALNPTMRIGAQVAEVMRIHRTRPGGEAGAAVDLLAQVGLPDPAGAAKAYPHQLSGGQRQRVVLAVALANDPALLVCDEPTTALDVTVQARMLDLIVSGVLARDAALLLITHDLAVVATACERVVVMYGGRIVESGPVRDVMTQPRHRYTQGLVAASDLARVDSRGRLATIEGTVPAAGAFPDGCVFRNRCPRATDVCAEQPSWLADGPGRGYACHHPADEADGWPPPATGVRADARPCAAGAGPATASSTRRTDEEGAGTTAAPIAATAAEPATASTGPTVPTAAAPVAPAVRVRDLVRRYPRPRPSLLTAGAPVEALRGVSFDVAPGERFGIVGESGCGKSTLLRLVSGLDRPTSGSVHVAGREISGRKEKDLRDLRRTMQLVFQDPMGSLDPRMTVRDIIAEPLLAQGATGRDERVAELLEAVGLRADMADRHPHQFSGGQRQRISIARALAPRPSILVADEPVSALDVSVRAQVLNLVADLVDELSLTLVLVSHDLSVVRHVCDRVAVMSAGRIVETGPTEQVYDDPRDPYTQSLIRSVPTLKRALSGATPAVLAGRRP